MYNLIPHFIINNFSQNKTSGQFLAYSLFVDISGFSTLTSQLMAHGQHGAEVLAGVMDETFEPLIDAVYSQGGFVTGFAGDAFTAVFSEKNALGALTAAVAIQKQMQAKSEQDTPYGRYTLSVKVGLAFGEVIWGIVRADNNQRASYFFHGTAIDGCAEAEQAAQPGEIILDLASSEALGDAVTSLPVGGHYRLSSVRGSLPEPQGTLPPGLNEEQVRHFVPESVIRAGRIGEFRPVVNMFVSLPTIRTEAQLDVFMQTVFDLQDRYGGLLKQLDFGDKGAKLLLFWGAPVAHENDIQRALHFILDLQSQTAIPINGGLTYQVAHAGYIGSSLRGEYTCYGSGVNLAARFMTSAPRGEIWVDEHIARRVGQQFDLEFEGEKHFKGFPAPEKVYILWERTDTIDPFYEGRLIGREADLALLTDFVAPLYQGGSSGMMVIWGEPGAGKSRLAYEFLEHHMQTDVEVQVFLAQADEIIRQSLNPFRYWLRRYFGQSEGLAESRNKRSFNRELDNLIAYIGDRQLADALDQRRSFLGALVGLYWPDSLYEHVDARERLTYTFAGLSALLKAESRRQPVVLLLEDAHWMDKDSFSFLTLLLNDLEQSDEEADPLAILATARYEGGHQLISGISYQELNLSTLNPAGLEALAEVHLDAPPADDLLSLLVEQSGGNPFFAEQIVRFLQESGQLEKDGTRWRLRAGEKSPLPGDVNALLVARLDRLVHTVREVVQTAAVLGREFDIRVLSQMLQGDMVLPEKINIAEQEAVWSALSEIRYIFKHALLRDAAYNMQLRARRKALHRLALEAIENVFQDDLSGRYGELAYHARSADIPVPTFQYSLLAGNQAMRFYAAAEAVSHYRPAMDLVNQVDTSPEQRLQLCALYGRALELTGDPAAALAHYEQMEILAQELGDQKLELTAVVAQGTIRSTGNVMSNFEFAEALGQKGLQLAEALNDTAAEAKIRWNLIHAYRLSGRFKEALASGRQAYALAEANDLREQMAYIANDLGTVYMALGEINQMRATTKQAVTLWRELDNRPMLSDGLAIYGLALAITGRFDDALAVAQEGLNLTQAARNLWGEAIMRYTPALVHLQRLEIAAGLEHAQISLRLAQEGGVMLAQFYMSLFQALLFLVVKDYPAAIHSAGQALAVADQHLPHLKSAPNGVMAMAHLEQGDSVAAGEFMRQIQVDLDHLGMIKMLVPELAQCQYYQAQAAYHELLALSSQVIAYIEHQKICLGAPFFYLWQAQAYRALDDHAAAVAAAQSGLVLLRQTGGRWGFMELATLMVELEEIAGNEMKVAEWRKEMERFETNST